jgi:hypothetical protein
MNGRGLDDVQADRLRSREDDDRDIGMLDESRADVFAAAREELDHALRRAGRTEGFHEARGDRRRLLRRLEDDWIAGDERGHGHATRDRQWEVPRRDHDRHALALVHEPVAFTRG